MGCKERCQLAVGLKVVIVWIKVDGGRCEICKVKTDVSLAMEREIGGMAMR